MSDVLLDQLYPDVLGAISRGQRTNLDTLQVALGVFPRQAFLNQPVELVLLLQNMVDQPTQVKVTLALPPQDKKGNLLVLDTPKQKISADLQAGEVGALRIPIIALPPTQPGTDIPVYVSISHKSGRGARPVRSRSGGMPPGGYAVSAFKLQALRDVSFSPQTASQETSRLTTSFDIAPKRLDPKQYLLMARYETLWTTDEMRGERELLQSKVAEARALASAMTTTNLYWSVYYATEEKFARRGVMLGEGELKAIAKIMTYTLSDATMNERSYSLNHSRWFQTLCYALMADPELPNREPGAIAAEYLYDTAVHDAIVLGFRVIQPRVTGKLGSEDEYHSYADKVTDWLAGQGQGDVRYIYLPLIMAGVAVNVLVATTSESPWVMIDQLRADAAVRAADAGKESAEVFQMVSRLLDKAEFELTRMNYTRPEADA
jgi:hypothetical protein